MSAAVLRRTVSVLVVIVTLAGCSDDQKESAAVASSSSVSSTTPSTLDTTTTTTAPTTTTTAPGLSEASPLRFDGIGPIKVGMTLAQATAAVGKPVTLDPKYILDDCAYAIVQGGPTGLSFMVLRDGASAPWKIYRANVNEGSAIATVSGIRLGATEAQVKAAYTGAGKSGMLTVEVHPYNENGHYLIYDADGKGGKQLIFETDGAKVTMFRAGEESAVQAIEGCA
jgi:hypothetical protein